MKHRFLLFGITFGDNYGCDAIAYGTERILREEFPDCEIWTQGKASWRSSKWGYQQLFRNSIIQVKTEWRSTRPILFGKSILKKLGIFQFPVVQEINSIIKASSCVLSVGGDLYTFSNKEKDWPFPFPIMEAGNRVMEKGKPYVIWCASVGPLEKAGDRLLEMVNHLRACRAIIVREQSSFNYLKHTLGIDHNVFLAADPAFLMESEPFDFPFLDLKDKKILAANFSLGLMRHVFGDISSDEARAKCENLLCELLNSLSIRVLLVPHVGSDFPFLFPLFKELSNRYPNRLSILPSNIGAKRTKWAISKANALLTMRFHCSLAGFSTLTPTITLVSTSKGLKINEEMYGDLNYTVNICDMNSGAVLPKIKKILDKENEIRNMLFPRCKEMEERALSAGKILAREI